MIVLKWSDSSWLCHFRLLLHEATKANSVSIPTRNPQHVYQIDCSLKIAQIVFTFLDLIGRKRTMMLTNLPLLIAWILLYRATSTWEIFIANALLGLGSGIMEAPVIAYIGEIGEPEFRSFLMAYTYIGMTFGSLFVSILNTLMPWRLVAMVCIFVPIANTALLCFVSFSTILCFVSLADTSSMPTTCYFFV